MQADYACANNSAYGNGSARDFAGTDDVHYYSAAVTVSGALAPLP